MKILEARLIQGIIRCQIPEITVTIELHLLQEQQ
jgi:hypothetical protein